MQKSGFAQALEILEDNTDKLAVDISKYFKVACANATGPQGRPLASVTPLIFSIVKDAVLQCALSLQQHLSFHLRAVRDVLLAWMQTSDGRAWQLIPDS